MLNNLLAERANLVSTADFNSHRQRCSRKIQKLRKKQGIITRPNKHTSPKPKQGNGELLAWQSQRAWAAAMELRSALEAQAGSGLRRQSLDKLGKAAKFAKQAAAADPSIDTLTLSALSTADYYAARNSWDTPREAYAQARFGLETFKDAICQDYIASHVDPALKLAISKTGGSALDTETFSRKTAAKSPLGQQIAAKYPDLLRGLDEPPSQKLGEISWRRHTARVEDADLARLILMAREKDAALDPTKEAQVDDVLQLWATALDATKQLLVGASPEDQLHVVSTYVAYSLIVRRIQRDELAAAGVDTVAGVRLIDNVLQSCKELEELPGVYADELLGQSIDGMTSYFMSKRLALLARAYAQHDNELNALALINEARTLVADADIAVAELPVSASMLQQWKRDLDLDLKRAYGSALLANAAMHKPVSNDMNEFPAGPAADVLARIIDTSRLQMIPVKPVFYDLAYSYIQYPNDAPASASASPAPDAPSATPSPGKKRGIFGLFKGS